ncbi:histidine phosphatase family protein [Amycolatopsis alkalitolerans]|uniref:Histidine phosphatase family protein n=1 Tax=Amycolatopsis alkalitolerans TaxID=2547244 RepID=A0A5C4M280_9PSEU|nr:histidine phosphatase family protein [Amycolatopsis alkalitolerans]TNC26955.1 histidine phosphatase family protein [Amycolatopsis alkalitolerans]
MATLHLVRHGESEWNLAGRVQGQSPEAGALTPRGLDQAAGAAALLAQRNPRAEAIFSSDLPRARQTADVIAAALGLPVREDPRLREQDLGCLEGLRLADPLGEGVVHDEIERLWREPWRRPGDGESITDLYERIHGTLKEYAGQGRELILVAHGGPVRVAMTTADPRLREPVPRVAVGNATVTTVDH